MELECDSSRRRREINSLTNFCEIAEVPKTSFAYFWTSCSVRLRNKGAKSSIPTIMVSCCFTQLSNSLECWKDCGFVDIFYILRLSPFEY